MNDPLSSHPPVPSAWSPLRYRLFRAVWVAAFFSNIGTWIQDVGAAWLMTSLAPSPVMVALVRTASAAPMFLLALPSGALADILDRRRLLLVTQALMLFAAGALAILTYTGMTTPLLLLMLTFALGIGTALNAPAWQSIVAELVPRAELTPAISLQSASINLARSVGPAIGGLLIVAGGPGVNFALNAISFCGVMAVLYRWRRQPVANVLPAERMLSAMRTGLRYVRHTPAVLAVLARSSAFTIFASALLSLLPALARFELGRGPTGYGLLLGLFGAGAVLTAILLPRLRAKHPAERIVALAIFVFAGALVALAWIPYLAVAELAVFMAGGAWLTLLSTFNSSIQAIVPSWVRGRVISVSILVFFGCMATGSAIWGYIATVSGLSTAFSIAAIGLLLGLRVTYYLRIARGDTLDLSPSVNWPGPTVREFEHHRGPVVVMVEYQIDPTRVRHFRRVMQLVRRIRRRDGAVNWGLLGNVNDAGRYTETFVVESWIQHLRQHERVTMADRAVLDKARSFHVAGERPLVSHFIVEPLSN